MTNSVKREDGSKLEEPLFSPEERAEAHAIGTEILGHLANVKAAENDVGARGEALSAMATSIKRLISTVGLGLGGQHHIEKEGRRSVATCQYDLKGPSGQTHSDIEVALSGVFHGERRKAVFQETLKYQPGMNRFFSTLVLHGDEVDTSGGPIGHDRFHDAEMGMLEKLAALMTQNTKLPTDSALNQLRFGEWTGTVDFVSDYVICESCQEVIAQFRRMFPNVTVIPRSNEVPVPSSS